MLRFSSPRGATPRGASRATLRCAGLLLWALWLGTALPAAAQLQLLCFAGTFSPTGTSPCTPCPVGTFAAGRGSKQCQPCPPGTYADLQGSVACVRDEAEWPEDVPFPIQTQCSDDDDLEKCIKGGIRTGGIVHVIDEELPAQEVLIEGKSFTLRPLAGVTPRFEGHSEIIVIGSDDDVSVEIEGLEFEDGRIHGSPGGSGRFEIAIRDNTISGTAPPGPIAISSLFLPQPPGPTAFEIIRNRLRLASGPSVVANAIGVTLSGNLDNTGTIRGNVIDPTGDQAGAIELVVDSTSLVVDVIGNLVMGAGFKKGIDVAQFGDSELVARIANNAVAGQVDASGVRGAIVVGTVTGNGDVTIVNNSVAFNETGLQVSSGFPSELSADVANNAIAFNAQGLLLDGDSTSNAFNLVFGNGSDSFTPGPGTLQADPLFSEALTLTPQSPARNAGSDAHVPPDLTVDLAGGPRIVGPHVDIGAYELPEPSGALAACAAAGALAASWRARARPRRAQDTANGRKRAHATGERSSRSGRWT